VITSRFEGLRIGAVGGVFLAVAAGAPFALAGLASNGYSLPGLPTSQSVMALLDARSPGDRQIGELSATKTKAKPQQIARRPTQRALGKIVRPKPAIPTEFVQAITPAVPPVAVAPGVQAPTLSDVVPPVTLVGVPGVGGGNLPVVIGGGGGGGGVVPPGIPGNPVTATPEVTTAVPEPSTWLLMLLGFGAIGVSARRRNAATWIRSRTV
jgi:hypothetical protein